MKDFFDLEFQVLEKGKPVVSELLGLEMLWAERRRDFFEITKIQKMMDFVDSLEEPERCWTS